MKAGDTFFLAGGAADRHLRVIISDPSIDPQRVLFVSMTSYDVSKEDACLLNVADHPFVQSRPVSLMRTPGRHLSSRSSSYGMRDISDWASPSPRNSSIAFGGACPYRGESN